MDAVFKDGVKRVMDKDRDRETERQRKRDRVGVDIFDRVEPIDPAFKLREKI